MRRILSSGLLFCMALSTIQAFAQLGSTTSLVGTTTDSSGAIVAGAKITAVNIATHDTYETVTNGRGDYDFPFVQIGTYQITAAGLRHLEREISSFERMFEGIALVLNPADPTSN